MEIKYDKDTDVLYIKLREGNIVESEETEKNVVVDFDKNGAVLGIEILYFIKNNKKEVFPLFKEVEKVVWEQYGNFQTV